MPALAPKRKACFNKSKEIGKCIKALKGSYPAIDKDDYINIFSNKIIKEGQNTSLPQEE
jgi:hypothetical protein